MSFAWGANPTPQQIAAKQRLPFCRSVLELMAKTLMAEGNKPVSPPVGLEERIVRADEQRNSRNSRKTRFYELYSPQEWKIAGDIKDNTNFKNVTRDLLTQLQTEVEAEGGEIRISNRGKSYLRLEGSKPIVGIEPFAEEAIVAHELDHFRFWRKTRDDLILKGLSKEKSNVRANHILTSSFGLRITEARAVAVEMGIRISQLNNIEKDQAYSFPFHSKYGELNVPIELLVDFENLLSNVSYHLEQQLVRIFQLIERTESWRMKLTSLPSSRKNMIEDKKLEAKATVNEMLRDISELRKVLIEEAFRLSKEAEVAGDTEVAAEHRKVALELMIKPIFDYLFTTRSKESQSRESKDPTFTFFETLIRTELPNHTPLTVLDESQQLEIRKVLDRKGTTDDPDNDNPWRSQGRYSPTVEFAHQQGRQLSLPEFDQLDLGAISLLDPSNINIGHPNNISNSRVRSYLYSPIIDPVEIRRRQDAVKEIMYSDKMLIEQLKSLYESEDSVAWRRKHGLFGEEVPKIENAFWQIMGDNYYFYQFILKKGILPPNDRQRWLREALQIGIERVQSFFDEVERLREILTKANSPRLKQLKWVLDAAFDLNHPMQLAQDVRIIIGDGILLSKIEAFERLRKSKQTQILLEAVGEIALHYDIARHAIQNGFVTFPKILDRDPSIGPVFNVEQLHNLRVLQTNPGASIPNSIQLGGNNGRNLIITGPNAEGKSTFPRSMTQLGILAQLGSPVPAKSAELTPLSYLTYVHPTDAPKDEMSLFMAEGRTLWKKIYEPAKYDPFTLTILDEIIPGTIPVIREDVETEFLIELSKSGGLSVTATHNWGTTSLGDNGFTTPNLPPINHQNAQDPSQTFRNFHVNRYQLKPDAASDMKSMYEAAIEALRKVGWPETLLNRIRERGQRRIEASQKK